MKQSNKILLYGLLASILLILLCLYTHQDEFSQNNTKDEQLSKPIEMQVPKKERDVLALPRVENKEPEAKDKSEAKKEEVPVNKPLLIAEEKNNTIDKNSSEKKTSDEKNQTKQIHERTIFKNKEEIVLKIHPKVKPVEKKVEEVDKNLPIEDNKPLVDNDKFSQNLKTEAKPKKVKKEKKEAIAKKLVVKKVSKTVSHKDISTMQEKITAIANRNISFLKSKSQLTNKSKATLNKIIKILKQAPNAKIVVKGYTDASGKAKTNQWISEERAKSVRRYLGQHGIPLKNIRVKGYGESELLYGDKPYSKLNRRVEIEIKRK